MSIEVLARVDRDLSVDPSCIVRYQVFDGDFFLGDGVVQYHRHADYNDIAIPDTIRNRDGSPLADDVRESIVRNIHQAACRELGIGD